jgi:hypothetical protein
MNETEIVLLRELEALEKTADDARLRAAANKASWQCALKRLKHAHSERTVLKRDREQMRQERNEWRWCAEKLHAAVCYFAPQLLSEDGYTDEKAAVREFMRLSGGGK